MLAGPLLPYALRFGLASDDGIPLARFAHAAVRALVSEPGWAPPPAKKQEYGEISTSSRGYQGGMDYGAF